MVNLPKALLGCLLWVLVSWGCTKIAPTWETLTPVTDARLWDVDFVDDQLGFAVGGLRYQDETLLKTTDGGQTWTAIEDSLIGKVLFDVRCLNENQVFASGLDGKVIYSWNAGLEWNVYQLSPWAPIHAIEFLGQDKLIAVGGNGYDDGYIFQSNDFGQNWMLIDTFDYELRDVQFTSELVGYACGYGTVLKTEDGGASWDFTDASGDFFVSLDFPSAEVGYAVGRTGQIIKTSDAGTTWTHQRNGSVFAPRKRLNAVHFLNEQLGYAAGDAGIVFKTTDGGDKWEKFERPEKIDWYGVHIFEEGHGILVGEGGQTSLFTE